MRQHEHVDVKKHDQHKNDSSRRKPAGSWNEEPDAAEYLRHPAYEAQEFRDAHSDQA